MQFSPFKVQWGQKAQSGSCITPACVCVCVYVCESWVKALIRGTTMRRLVLLYLSGLVCWAPVRSHPQCLDFKPPFQPLRELQFCTMYKHFGCCDFTRDQELMKKFYHIMDNFDYYEYASCASYVQDLLCQVSGQHTHARAHTHLIKHQTIPLL